mmetsp:Transcript_7400/g.12498  ORF Transcript_7400/g.12498 Transcript_7400/m.12498 type:complete len:144 (+) Transcript_7400:380-811(+)
MTQTVRALMEHPNLPQSDFYKVDAYCKLFQLDWRGDRSLENKKEFMATNPFYLHPRDRPNFVGATEIKPKSVIHDMKKACIPFIEPLTQRLFQMADQDFINPRKATKEKAEPSQSKDEKLDGQEKEAEIASLEAEPEQPTPKK